MVCGGVVCSSPIKNPIANGLMLVGDAAHSIHPIAGQGWNLGIRDIKNLSLAIDQGLSLGMDIGDQFVCKKYDDLSYFDAFCVLPRVKHSTSHDIAGVGMGVSTRHF